MVQPRISRRPSTVATPTEESLGPDQCMNGNEGSPDLSDCIGEGPTDSKDARHHNGTGQPGGDTAEELSDTEELQASKRDKNKRPHLQGRFSGRLETKEDEKRCAEECKLLGPLLGGSGRRGEKSRMTLAKIVRGIASGQIRAHLEAKEADIKRLQSKVSELMTQIAVLGTQVMGGSGSSLRPQAPPPVAAPGNGARPSQSNMAPAIMQPTVEIPVAPVVQTPEAKRLLSDAAQLQAQAQNFAVHANQLVNQSLGEDGSVHVLHKAVEAQSFQQKARSLQAAATAQSLQAEAISHANAQAMATLRAQQLTKQAHEVAVQVNTSTAATEALGVLGRFNSEGSDPSLLQTKLAQEAHTMAAKAHHHAQAQAQAQLGAAAKAEEAHALDEAAQQLQLQAKNAVVEGFQNGPPSMNMMMMAEQEQGESPSKRSRLMEPGQLETQQGHLSAMNRLPVSPMSHHTAAMGGTAAINGHGTMAMNALSHYALNEDRLMPEVYQPQNLLPPQAFQEQQLMSTMYQERQDSYPVMSSLPMRNY